MSFQSVNNIQNTGSQIITVDSNGNPIQNGVEYSVRMRATNSLGSAISNSLQAMPSEGSSEDWELYEESPSTDIEWTTIKQRSMTDSAGLVGIKSLGESNHPSSNPNDWTIIPQDFLVPNDIWGTRATPVGVFKLVGGVGLFYQSGSPQTSSVARTVNGQSWGVLNGGQPVLGFNTSTDLNGFAVWDRHGYSQRVMGRNLLYNYDNGYFYCYYTTFHAPWIDDAGYHGRRAQGVAWSQDALNWEWVPTSAPGFSNTAPALTHLDVQSLYPEISYGSNSHNDGRVYIDGSDYRGGYYYIRFSFNDETSAFHLGGARSQNPNGPWERVDYLGIYPNETNIVEYDGKYYACVSRLDPNNSNNRGATILESNNYLGPYTMISEAPLYTTGYTGNHGEQQLWMHNGVWFIAQRVRGDDIASIYGGTSDSTRIMKVAYYDPN